MVFNLKICLFLTSLLKSGVIDMSMDEMSKEELENALNECNDEIMRLQQRLIDALNAIGIEYVDLYEFISELDNLKHKKK